MKSFSFLLLAVLILGGCFQSAQRGDLDSADPAAILYGIRQAAHDRDERRIPTLVELLEHDDGAVRLLSIMALERITQLDCRLGYDPYGSMAERDRAVHRWVNWVREDGREGWAQWLERGKWSLPPDQVPSASDDGPVDSRTGSGCVPES
ncbi:MAG: HEAT repeat domain-containing protein [Phycisphaeraceae bacterium]|nr:HEAT repeat domain-containing protein [Phycisphaeraceae bacterium]